MATTNKPSYNLDWLKQNAQAGFGISDMDLKKYGIDYSEEDRNNIAKIFQDSATAAYKQAQTNFSNTMAQEQATLQDTLRRSQAEAVATGASRGMQAANELSSMLGLQQTAAQNASAMQSDYAAAMAAAQENAMGIQNTRGQIGATIAASDLASEAQKYAANMSAALSDPYRLFTEVQDLIDQGKEQEAKYLLSIYAASSGMSADAIKDLVDNWTYAPNTQAPETDTNGDGTIDNNDAPAKPSPSVPSLQTGGLDVQLNNYNDKKGTNFNINIGDTKYSNLELMDEEDKNSNAWKIAKAKKVGDGQMFVYDDKLYVRKNEKVYRVGDAGLDPNNFLGGLFKRYNEYDTGNVAKIKEYLRQNGYSYDLLGNSSTDLPKATLKNYKTRTGENFNANFAGENYKGLEVGTKYGANSPEANAAKDVEDGQFFLYNDQIYVKAGTDVFRVGGTGTKGTDNEGKSSLFGKTEYNDLKNALKSAGYTDLAPEGGAGVSLPRATIKNMPNKNQGQNFNADFNGTNYKGLEVGTKYDSSSAEAKAASSVEDGQFFLYNGEVYLKSGSDAYRIGGTGTKGTDNEGKTGVFVGKTMYTQLRQALKNAGYTDLASGATPQSYAGLMTGPAKAEFFANLVLESKQRAEYKKNKISTGLNALQDLISEHKKR